ncbi:Transmembrane protein [Trema orientale]|uniref:Transmembrane protein n=1 Tax=Trema orientale TaxID=63057 RepID=A0A2P5FD80_TREOI|nr:Transmembrane protein [Trema orientale]
MDPIKLEKIQAIKKYKRNQLMKNLLLYSLTALTCLFLFSPLWLPSSSSMEVLLFVYVPKLPSLFFSSKFVFIVGNLIVVALIGDSKIFFSCSSPASEAYYEEYISTRQISLHKVSAPEEKKESYIEEKKMTWEAEAEIDEKRMVGKRVGVVKKLEDFDGDGELTLPTEVLKKRADDFIARVNKQRIFEARELLCDDEWRKRTTKI